MYFLRIGEPYVIKASDGATAGTFPSQFVEALEKKQIKGYWFVEEGGVPEAILYVTPEIKDAFSSNPGVRVTTKQKAKELIFKFHPLSLFIEELPSGELQLLVNSPFLEETIIKDSAGNEIGRNLEKLTVSKPVAGETETWALSLWDEEVSSSFFLPPLPLPELLVSQVGSEFTLSVSNLGDRTYDLYICDATASVVDFTAANLIAEGLSSPYVDTLSVGDKRIAKAKVDGTATNQVYYELSE
jgi:hypothetical protein